MGLRHAEMHVRLTCWGARDSDWAVSHAPRKGKPRDVRHETHSSSPDRARATCMTHQSESSRETELSRFAAFVLPSALPKEGVTDLSTPAAHRASGSTMERSWHDVRTQGRDRSSMRCTQGKAAWARSCRQNSVGMRSLAFQGQKHRQKCISAETAASQRTFAPLSSALTAVVNFTGTLERIGRSGRAT